MNILGEKIILRAIEDSDDKLLLDMINDPETERMLGGSSKPVSMVTQKKWMAAQCDSSDTLRCIIAPKNAPQDGVGTVILSDIDYKNGVAQIHIKLIERGRGKGFGSDALKTLTRYAFEEMRMNCVYGEVLEYNTVSQKMFIKCGYEQDGILRQRVFKNGSYHNVLVFSALKEKQNV